MTEWLMWFDEKIKKENHTIILFLDNEKSHPDFKFKKTNLIFLPPNTTSHCQLLEQWLSTGVTCHPRVSWTQ
jgi:hypothetical protein